MIEKEPVTVILSKRGWIRAQRGHVAADQWGEFKFKEGDELAFAAHAQTTNKLLVAASDGRFFTVGADKLPGGRGFGEPLRLMVDIEPEARIVALIPAQAEGRTEKRLVGKECVSTVRSRGEADALQTQAI